MNNWFDVGQQFSTTKLAPIRVLFSWWEEVLADEANRSTERSEGLPRLP